MKATIAAIVVSAAIGWGVWQWFFCRFYVGPDQMAVVTAKSGDPLAPGQILAKPGQRGVREDVLGEGRHFLDPFFHDIEILPTVMIPPGKIGVVTSKGGADLPQGVFLAEKGQKGIWREVLGPGKYRMNPAGYHIDVVDATSIPIGYVGVVTSLAGEQAVGGEFSEAHQKGVRKDVVPPGLYYANPKELKIDVLEIGLNQVSLLGADGGQVITKARMNSQNRAFEDMVDNTLQKQAEKRMEYMAGQQMTFDGAKAEDKDWNSSSSVQQRAGAKPTKKDKSRDSQTPSQTPVLEFSQFVEFPSRDGFEIHLDMTVEFELLPQNIAWIFKSYGDLPAVVDKIIMPQIQSISRLKGSAYRAIDFIVGEGREKFQNELREALVEIMQTKQIVIHNALVRQVGVPEEILDPIQKSSIAVEEDLTNKEKQNMAKKQAELNTELSLIEQRGKEVGEETIKLKAEIRAEEEKLVATIAAETQKRIAEIEKATTAQQAEKALKIGRARAEVIKMVEGSKADGFGLKLKAVGDPTDYNLRQFAEKLNPEVRVNILHAGEGTLWTDLSNASLGDLGGAKILKHQPSASQAR